MLYNFSFFGKQNPLLLDYYTSGKSKMYVYYILYMDVRRYCKPPQNRKDKLDIWESFDDKIIQRHIQDWDDDKTLISDDKEFIYCGCVVVVMRKEFWRIIPHVSSNALSPSLK